LDDLTKEQKIFLASMYKEYLCRQPALSSDEANKFHTSAVVQETIMPNQTIEYVTDLCFALRHKGYISCVPGSNLALHISITDKTIIVMENRFSNGIKSVIDFISIIKP